MLSMGLFFWLLSRQDWVVTWKNLNRLPAWVWPSAFGLVVCGMFCNAWRWYLLLKAQAVPIPFWEVVKTVFTGAFASNFLPSTIGGDAFRVISLLRFTTDRTLSVASVLMDRALNVVAYLSFLPFSAAVIHIPPDVFSRITAAAFLLNFSWIKKVKSISIGFRDRLFQVIRMWARRPKTIAVALVISWLSIVVVFLAVWLIADGLEMPVKLYHVIGVSVITYLVTLLPISVNGYGLREVTVTAMYVSLGATLEQASTLALLTRLFMLVETLPGAFWFAQIISYRGKADANLIDEVS